MKQHLDEWGGSIELVKGRKVHVKTRNGGYDKMVLTFRFECADCDYAVNKDGLPALDRIARLHSKQEHKLVVT
jgi:hypothetical protein